MRSRSTLARLQQATTLALLFCAAGWLAWHWRDARLTGLAGFVAITMGYSFVLALEFVAVRAVGRSDPAPRPTWAELTRAWLAATASGARVFYWQQPFRWRAVPDQLEVAPTQRPRRGVVFIHGFVANRGFWNPWLVRLRTLGHPFIAPNLEPVFGSIDDYVPLIEDAVQRMEQATGLAPVLVCHSMGGVAARAWLRAKPADRRAHHIITIASPHAGTLLARFSRMKNGHQLRPDGEWIGHLAQSSGPERNARFTCWYSNCDNVVFPASAATLAGADNRLIRGIGHVALAFHPRVIDESLAKIAG